ncbi:MAG: hypothetical protein NDF54_10915 [archaeon GB-1867-035]|nr:hypothetical protein [Candidatus Culexmicrobium profundum]
MQTRRTIAMAFLLLMLLLSSASMVYGCKRHKKPKHECKCDCKEKLDEILSELKALKKLIAMMNNEIESIESKLNKLDDLYDSIDDLESLMKYITSNLSSKIMKVQSYIDNQLEELNNTLYSINQTTNIYNTTYIYITKQYLLNLTGLYSELSQIKLELKTLLSDIASKVDLNADGIISCINRITLLEERINERYSTVKLIASTSIMFSVFNLILNVLLLSLIIHHFYIKKQGSTKSQNT